MTDWLTPEAIEDVIADALIVHRHEPDTAFQMLCGAALMATTALRNRPQANAIAPGRRAPSPPRELRRPADTISEPFPIGRIHALDRRVPSGYALAAAKEPSAAGNRATTSATEISPVRHRAEGRNVVPLHPRGVA